MRNPTLLQCFHWYYPTGGELWREVEALAPSLNEIGINMIWLPPAYKGASGGYSVGYDSYDLFDLGEFDQKGSVATKYGDKGQLLAAIDALKTHDIAVLLDVVVNHKMGADEKEPIRVQRVDENDRTQISDEIIECEAWTKYTFPVRAGQYSQFIWDYKCFSGVDHIENPDEDGIFKVVNDYTGDGWNDQVDGENGNFDYLMGENIDYRNRAVTEEIKYWARWVMEQTGCDGFRLDAVKHIPAWFYKEWIEHVQEVAPKPLFIVAEYWSHEVDKLQAYIDQVDGQAMLFEGALSAMKKASILIGMGDIAGKGQALSKAINIIANGLQAGLDHSAGGELSTNLDGLYDYMTRRLLHANLHNDIGAIEEVLALLKPIAEAWNEIGSPFTLR